MPARETVSSLETQALSLSCVLLCPQPQAQGGLTILATCSRPPDKPGLVLGLRSKPSSLHHTRPHCLQRDYRPTPLSPVSGPELGSWCALRKQVHEGQESPKLLPDEAATHKPNGLQVPGTTRLTAAQAPCRWAGPGFQHLRMAALLYLLSSLTQRRAGLHGHPS